MQMMAKKYGRSVFADQIKGMEPRDPHMECYTSNSGKVKTRRRAIPAGLNKRDSRVLKSVRRRAHYLDKGFSLFGFRFGWAVLFALIPGLGDVFVFFLGYMLIIRKCREAELPPLLMHRMLFNLSIGSGVGLVPIVGDLVMAVWKPNSRNAALLEDFLISRAEQKNSTGVPATEKEEDKIAKNTIGNTKISSTTGEIVQGKTFGECAGPSEHVPQNFKGPEKKDYKWGEDEDETGLVSPNTGSKLQARFSKLTKSKPVKS